MLALRQTELCEAGSTEQYKVWQQKLRDKKFNFDRSLRPVSYNVFAAWRKALAERGGRWKAIFLIVDYRQRFYCDGTAQRLPPLAAGVWGYRLLREKKFPPFLGDGRGIDNVFSLFLFFPATFIHVWLGRQEGYACSKRRLGGKGWETASIDSIKVVECRRLPAWNGICLTRLVE